MIVSGPGLWDPSVLSLCFALPYSPRSGFALKIGDDSGLVYVYISLASTYLVSSSAALATERRLLSTMAAYR